MQLDCMRSVRPLGNLTQACAVRIALCVGIMSLRQLFTTACVHPVCVKLVNIPFTWPSLWLLQHEALEQARAKTEAAQQYAEEMQEERAEQVIEACSGQDLALALARSACLRPHSHPGFGSDFAVSCSEIPGAAGSQECRAVCQEQADLPASPQRAGVDWTGAFASLTASRCNMSFK